MKTISEIIKNLRSTKGQYAVEVEMIGRNMPAQVEGFHLEPDGSLGPGGVEYVFDKPTSLDKATQLVDGLYNSIKANNSKLHDQARAGIHTHINVQDWTIKRLFNFVCLYYIFEPIIMRWCGEMREGNHFCLRLSDAEYPVHLIKKSLETRKLSPLKTEDIRYASLNFLSLFKYGSLELRGMRTPDNANDVITWLRLVDCMVDASARFDNPISIVESMSMDGYGVFLDSVFRSMAPVFSDIQQKDRMMQEGVWMSQDIAYCFDWSTLEQKVKEEDVNPFRIVYMKPEKAMEKYQF